MTPRIAVFAGTHEGHELCAKLSVEGICAMAFVATEYGAELLAGLSGIEVRQGRLDEAAMRETLGGFSLVVDATHPYAVEVSANLRRAVEALGISYVRLLRASGALEDGSWSDVDGVDVRVVPNCEKAAELLDSLEGRVLVTTGSKDLAAYTSVRNYADRLVVRVLASVDSLTHALELGYSAKNVICMQGPFSRELNVAMLHQVGASWLVTKDTGAPGGLPQKIAAARDAGCGVVLISRPVSDEQGVSLAAALEACRQVAIPIWV